MPSPLQHVDVGTLIGSWPLALTPTAASPSLLPNSLNARATLLGIRRATSYAVGTKSFILDLDPSGGGAPVAHTVSFPAGSYTLNQIVTLINTDVTNVSPPISETAAFNDNGFLRLKSPRTGTDSYVGVRSVFGAEDIFAELGLFSGSISKGGTIQQAQHVDPSRQIALPGQLGMNWGETFGADTMNRQGLQLGWNVDLLHGFADLKKIGFRKDETINVGAGSIQLNSANPTQGVYTGPNATPTTEQLRDVIKVLDSSGNEYTKEISDILNGDEAGWTLSIQADTNKQLVTSVSAIFVAGDVSDAVSLVLTGGNAGALAGLPLKIVEYISTTQVVVQNIDPTNGNTVNMTGTITGRRVRVYTVRAQVEAIYKESGFVTRVEQLSQSLQAAAVSKIQKNSQVYCSAATFITNGVQVGDKVTWSGASSADPYTNNGTYRVRAVIDEKTIDLVSANFGPVYLNPNIAGGFGSVTVTTDGDFWRAPYIKFALPTSGNLAAGYGAVPINGETIRVVYLVANDQRDALESNPAALFPTVRYTHDVSAQVQRALMRIVGPSVTKFDDILYSQNWNSIEKLDFRMDKEHYDFGRHSTIRPDVVDMFPGVSGITAKFRSSSTDDAPVAAALSGTWTWNGTTTVTATNTSQVALGDTIRLDSDGQFFTIIGIVANTSVTILAYGMTIPTGATGSSYKKAGDKIQLRDSSDVVRAILSNAGRFVAGGSGQRPYFPYGIPTFDAQGTLGGSGFFHAGGVAPAYMAQSSSATSTPETVLGNARYVLRWDNDSDHRVDFVLNMGSAGAGGYAAAKMSVADDGTGASLINQQVWFKSGAIGFNLGSVVPNDGAAGTPLTNVHIRARSLADKELLRLEGFGSTQDSVALSWKPRLDQPIFAFVEMDHDPNPPSTGDWIMNFTLTHDAKLASNGTGPTGIGEAYWRWVQNASAVTALSGTWTWNGTTTVTSTNTSQVAVGDSIRLDSDGNFFQVVSIVTNVSVTIQNPLSLVIPTGATGSSYFTTVERMRLTSAGLSFTSPSTGISFRSTNNVFSLLGNNNYISWDNGPSTGGGIFMGSSTSASITMLGTGSFAMLGASGNFTIGASIISQIQGEMQFWGKQTDRGLLVPTATPRIAEAVMDPRPPFIGSGHDVHAWSALVNTNNVFVGDIPYNLWATNGGLRLFKNVVHSGVNTDPTPYSYGTSTAVEAEMWQFGLSDFTMWSHAGSTPWGDAGWLRNFEFLRPGPAVSAAYHNELIVRNGVLLFDQSLTGANTTNPDRADAIIPNTLYSMNIVKAWAKFVTTGNGTTAVLAMDPADGFNISTVLVNGLDEYEVHFYTPLTTTGCAVVVCSNYNENGTFDPVIPFLGAFRSSSVLTFGLNKTGDGSVVVPKSSGFAFQLELIVMGRQSS